MTSGDTDLLSGVEAYLFDVFGTVVDWQGSVARELQEKHYDGILERACLSYVVFYVWLLTVSFPFIHYSRLD